MIRLIDVLVASLGMILCGPLLVVLWVIGWFETRAPLFCQTRVGYRQRVFLLVKSRTMHLGTESKATHLVESTAVTRFGGFLRHTKLDELPQLWNVIRGEMSLVGPRPCLPNQRKLIFERAARDVFDVRPGITGLAQIQGIDMSTPKLLAITDAEMLKTLDVVRYFGYIFHTVLGKGSGDSVRNNSHD